MCRGEHVQLLVTIDASLSHSGQTEAKVKPIDRCIADLVAALEASGIRMLGSCCGHDDRDGEILLVDGRVLRVAPR